MPQNTSSAGEPSSPLAQGVFLQDRQGPSVEGDDKGANSARTGLCSPNSAVIFSLFPFPVQQTAHPDLGLFVLSLCEIQNVRFFLLWIWGMSGGQVFVLSDVWNWDLFRISYNWDLAGGF